MFCSTLKNEGSCWHNRLLTFLLVFIMMPALNTLNAQTCPNPPSVLVNGNFEQPATAIGTSEPGNINNNMPGWDVSHGHPSTQSLPPRTIWMWSYKSTSGTQKGEGIFNCYDFQAGQSYLVCFDLQTNGKADGATVQVRASNSVTTSAGTVFPSFASDPMWSDLTANYSYNSWSQVSFVYTPSTNYSQIWIYPFWSGITRQGTPAPQGNPYQAEMRIDNVSITPVSNPDECYCDITADFTYSIEDSCEVQFSEAASGNCCTNVLGYQWDFGDGTSSTSANPTHTYTASGTYTVCLTTIGLDAYGDCCTDTVCYTITPDCTPCVCDVTADFTYGLDPTKCVVNFNDKSVGNECTNITGWSWNFGDGTTSNAQNPSHQYPNSGTYTVCLVVTGTNGNSTCTDSICYEIDIDCIDDCLCDIDISFAYDINKCRVDFFGDVNTDCQVLDWDWDFGDGNGANGQNVSHVYSGNGTYTVCLTVTVQDADGTICKDTYCEEIVIDDCGDCECDISVNFDYSIDKCTVDFFGAADSNCEIIDWSWDFGDGNGANGQNVSHTYGGNGTYTVCLTVRVVDANGNECEETHCIDIIIDDCDGCECDIDLDFTWDVDRCTAFFFSNINTNCEVVGVQWDFGDGTFSSVMDPTHTYSANGTYTVCLTVTVVDGNGVECTQTICQQVDIVDCDNDCPCTAFPDMGIDIRGCDVDFMGFGNADCPVIDYLWDFGDGNTGGGQNVTHTYATNGVYTVCLTIVMTAPDGTECYETICLQIFITDCDGTPVPSIQQKGGDTKSQNLPFEPKIYPNPTSEELFVEFETEQTMDIRVAVYNSSMTHIATLLNGEQEAGLHKVEWNADGNRLAAGTYFVMIKSGHKVKLEKVVVKN